MASLTDLDAGALQAALHGREVSCVEVLDAFLERIDRLNPQVNAIVGRAPHERLRAEARAKDEAMAAGGTVGPLHGFPLAIKDLQPARDLPHAAGSPIYAARLAETDSPMVARLRAAGAVLIGKTNIPEFSLGSQSSNPLYGPTRNAYDLTRTAGGSSSGAAVALALRMLPVADGSDYCGSLRNPAGWNNVFGFRPGPGVVPKGGDPLAPTMGVAGPMGRSVADLALLLSAQAGPGPASPFARTDDPAAFRRDLDWAPKGLRLAWAGDFGGAIPMERGLLDVCRDGLAAFEAIGCTVEAAWPAFDYEALWQAFVRLRASQEGPEFRALVADPDTASRLPPSARFEVETGAALSAYDLADAAALRSAWHATLHAFFERYDMLLAPTAQVFAFDLATPWPTEIAGRPMRTYHEWMQVASLATLAGAPALAVPAGFDGRGLAMGLQIIAPNRGELACLQLGHAYDQVTGWPRRRPPDLAA